MDPWGRPYRYLLLEGVLPSEFASVDRALPNVGANQYAGGQDTDGVMGNARKDLFLVPINSDFDLYSVGPDGLTQASLANRDSLDDVIRAADGAFYGLAENF